MFPQSRAIHNVSRLWWCGDRSATLLTQGAHEWIVLEFSVVHSQRRDNNGPVSVLFTRVTCPSLPTDARRFLVTSKKRKGMTRFRSRPRGTAWSDRRDEIAPARGLGLGPPGLQEHPTVHHPHFIWNFGLIRGCLNTSPSVIRTPLGTLGLIRCCLAAISCPCGKRRMPGTPVYCIPQQVVKKLG